MFVKDYFKDKLILAFSLLSLVLTIICTALILIRTDFSQAKIILRYLSIDNTIQLQAASPSHMYAFIVVAVLSLISGWVMSYKVYNLNKSVAYFSLVLTSLVLLSSILISESLLRI